MGDPPQTRPLDGIRVLDLSRLIPGPFCSLILSELGAEVIKVEDTRAGDYLRFIPPQKDGLGGAYYALNRGKRSIAVDLKQAAGRELLLRLLPRFQVVLESFRPGVMDRLGLGYETLAAASPDVILCSITGYGQDGPMRDRAGHDLNYLALAGVLGISGTAERPVFPGVQIADVAGGALWAVIRILAALHSGGGAHIDVSMTEGALSFLLPWLGELAFDGKPARRGKGLLNGGSPSYDVYATADDRHMAVGALEPKFWNALGQVLGYQTSGDPLAKDPPAPDTRQQLEQAIAAATRDEWTERLSAVDTCTEPVLEIDELAEHPLHRARHMFYTIDDPARGKVQQLRLPLDGAPADTPAPRQGEQTDQILEEEGLGPDEIAALRTSGVIR